MKSATLDEAALGQHLGQEEVKEVGKEEGRKKEEK